MEPYYDEEEDKKKRKDLLHKALFIENSTVLPEVAGELAALGDPDSFPHLMKRLATLHPPNSTFLEAVRNFAEKVQVPNPLPAILEALQTPHTEHLQTPLLNWCWEWGCDCSAHLPFFCELAVHGDIETGIEVLTIADNLSQQPSQEDLVKSLIILKNGMHGPEENKNALLGAIMETVNNY